MALPQLWPRLAGRIVMLLTPGQTGRTQATTSQVARPAAARAATALVHEATAPVPV
jgi:hypothetical protein